MAYRANNLFAELTASGSTAAYVFEGSANAYKVRVYLPDAASDGGGTLTLNSSIDGTNYVQAENASWTSGDNYVAEVTVFGKQCRFTLAGATSPSGVTPQIDVEAISPSFTKVFTGITDNTATLGATLYEFNLPINATQGIVWATGTFDSGVVKVQQSPDGGTTWYDVNFTGVSSAGGEVFDSIGKGNLFRVEVVSVAGAAADLDVTVMAA